jgi:hypothetical protein
VIVGAHSIVYSKNPEADRVFLRDVIKLPHVDVGEGWLIFGLPPSEVAEAVEVGIEMGGGPATVSARFALEVIDEVFPRKHRTEALYRLGVVSNVYSREKHRCNVDGVCGVTAAASLRPCAVLGD